MQELKDAVRSASKKLFKVEIEPELSRPDEQFGDYSTNVAMQLAKKVGKNPREVAEALASEISSEILAGEPTIAGPGFINFKLADKFLVTTAAKATSISQTNQGQSVVIEYSDPNPFKVLHVGHLYTSVIGDGISNLFSNSGAMVHRVNFGGDVGLHVAKTMWAILQDLGGKNPEKLETIKDRVQWMTDNYIAGNKAYDEDSEAKQQIEKLNKEIYQIVEDKEKDSPLAQIYWTVRGWSYAYFEDFYKRFGALGFEKYYPESKTVELGLKTVKENIGKVFEKSDGAIIFNGEVHNMHTRVFINSQGLPTYETKDVGLILLKDKDYKFDRSVVITGNEQAEYMQVVLKAIEQIKPALAKKTTHITHGMVRLPGSQKMSSRLGNIIGADSVLEMAKDANKEINKADDEQVALAAVKYSFLKQRLGADMVYDPVESVSLEGNSGPYLQYAYVRANSILHKAKATEVTLNNLEAGERSLVRKLSEFPEVFEKALNELMPHNICTYLYELAQTFNRFYENNRVVGDEREAVRLSLVKNYAEVLRKGLELLNIPVVEKM